ncbi:MAG TPA: DUF6499 domain-containing protein, partial [Sphingomicrobium sp.]|nr:DUF6499 domain-containing protein [Sphingomicrobium sp.]
MGFLLPVDSQLEIERNWRNADCYAELINADRTLFAWEWLRRDWEYRAAALDAYAGRKKMRARHFGLVRFEHPDLPVPRARP